MTDIFEVVIVQAEAAKRGAVAVWTVYERPKDYPIGWVARMFEITRAGPKPTGCVIKCAALQPIQEKLARAGLVKLPRSVEDEPQVVESWI